MLPQHDPEEADGSQKRAERDAGNDFSAEHLPPVAQPQLVQRERPDDHDVARDPELPPLLMISGTNSASTTARAISASKKPIAVAVSISPMNSAASHPPRFRSIVARLTSR